MALTASVKDELSRLDIKKSSVRKAEVSAMLRFAGGLHIISGRIVIEAEVDLASTARRLRAAIAEVYGHQSEIIVVSGEACAAGAAMWSASYATERLWHVRQASWMAVDGRCAGCRRWWSTVLPRTLKPCGAEHSLPMVPSPSQGGPRPWR